VPFIVMELLAGKELGELLRERGPLPPAEVTDYLAQTGRGLDRAHGAGIVHRDLKPANLFLAIREGEPPRVKILDFGIAKFLAGSSASSTHVAGTPLYMAPEQARKGASIGPTTDVWALGLIAYALLVGRPYWEVDDLAQLFGEMFAGDYEPPCARAERLGVELPPAFDAWFLRCVDPDPAARFPRAGEAASRLAEALAVPLPPASNRTLAPDDPLDDAPTRALSAPALAGVQTAGPVVPSVIDVRAPASARRPSPRRALGLGALAFAVAGAVVSGVLWARAKRANIPVDLSLGLSDTTCTLHPGGRVRCAGARLGQRGYAPTPEPLHFDGPVAELAIGKVHGCARMEDGTVQCWGQNADGQLGDGTTAAHAPAQVPVLHGVVHVAVGTHSSCALVATGRVKCWGGNGNGQVGDGTTVDRLSPVKVEGGVGMTAVDLGQDHACTAAPSGMASCWGRNADGELGDGTTSDRAAAAPVTGLANVAAVSVGGHFSCALLRDGTVQCWGSNADGALGDGTAVPSRPAPAPVAGITGATQISTGWRHACALLASGALRCWGQNTFGQVGDGTTTARPSPVAVEAGGKLTRVAAGRMHTCAIREDGVLLCWGRNQEAQLGDGTKSDRPEPVPVKW
jgi:hypothetical protein